MQSSDTRHVRNLLFQAQSWNNSLQKKISHRPSIVLQVTILSDDWKTKPTYGFYLYQFVQIRNIIRASGADQASSYSNYLLTWLIAFWLKTPFCKKSTGIQWCARLEFSWSISNCTSWKMPELLKRHKSPAVRRKDLLDIFYKNNSCNFLICKCYQLWLLLSLFNYSFQPIEIYSLLLLPTECYSKNFLSVTKSSVWNAI